MPSISGASISRALKEVSHIKLVTLAKKFNQSRKPMKITIFTSLENVTITYAKKLKRSVPKRPRRVKRLKKHRKIESESEKEDFCTNC